VSFRARIVSPLADGTHIVNSGVVDSDDTEPFMTNETDTVVVVPQLVIAKTDDRDEIAIGVNNTYYIIVRNLGPTPVTDVVITDVLPPEVTYLSSNKLPFSVSGQTIVWHVSTLQPGNFYFITVKVWVKPSALDMVLHNVVNVTSRQTGEISDFDDTLVSSMPRTVKEFSPLPHIDTEGNEFVTSNTAIYLNYTVPSLWEKTWFRIWKWIPAHHGWVLLFNWTTTEEGVLQGWYPIQLCSIGTFFEVDCCGLYQIEYYSINAHGWREPLQWNDVYVDCTPPVSVKTYESFESIMWFGPLPIHCLQQGTRIYINASDGSGSGVDEVWYKLYYPNGTLASTLDRPGDYALYQHPISVHGPDGYYLIYYRAIDHVGNLERERKQVFCLLPDS